MNIASFLCAAASALFAPQEPAPQPPGRPAPESAPTVRAVQPQSQTTQDPAKVDAKKEEFVYDERADARRQVAAALARASKENRRVLIQWGANWCGWCKRLAGTMRTDPDLRRKLQYEYDIVHIDVGRFDKHMDLAKELGAKFESIPFLTILDAEGKALVQQNTEPFETKIDGKSGHDATKLVEFLTQHEAKPRDADEVLAQGLQRARTEGKLVFLHFGAPWCGWCHRLEDWMARPEIATVLEKVFIDVKVDQDRMKGGEALLKAVAARSGATTDGIPWFALLDADGAVRAHSTGPKGNVGFPFQPDEVEYFGNMLRDAKVGLDDAEIAQLVKSLHANREAQQKSKATGN